MRFLVIALVLGFMALAGKKIIDKPALRYFKASEFGIWWPFMSNELLLKLDEFRHRWGYPVQISTNAGALGRHAGTSASQHNFDLLGEVRAADFFPTLPGGYITTEQQRRRAYQIARDVGFTGIGVYTDTQPGNMVHGDVRKDATPGNPATWSRIAGEYKSIGQVV